MCLILFNFDDFYVFYLNSNLKQTIDKTRCGANQRTGFKRQKFARIW